MIRLHLFFARDNDRAVILRQGPSKQFRMILWHRDTDTFEDGQWVKQKVYVERCDLSPDGAHFIYFMLDGRWDNPGKGSYTAISQPPYWTALALFPIGHTWGGGGAFIDARHYHADGDADIIGRASEVKRVVKGDADKGCTTGLRLETGGRAPLDREATRRLLAEPIPTEPWALYDRMRIPNRSELDRYDTKGGKLYRRRGMELELIRDFTDMEFKPFRAPNEGRVDPVTGETGAWQPLDRETP